MKLEFYCPLWGCAEEPFDVFCDRVAKAGYDGVELPFPLNESERKNMLTLLRVKGLKHIAQHWETAEPVFEKHKKEFEMRLRMLASTKPEFISSQSGRDWFSFEQNLELLGIADDVAARTGLSITHETHRSKMLFAAHVARNFLKTKEDLRLTLDISHWCAVAETMLDDQREAVSLAISRTDHIHARVGFVEGPQVPDPFVPEWRAELEKHLAWWSSILDRAEVEGRDKFTITCEFGPWPYMVNLPATDKPIADQWSVNVKMMETIRNLREN